MSESADSRADPSLLLGSRIDVTVARTPGLMPHWPDLSSPAPNFRGKQDSCVMG